MMGERQPILPLVVGLIFALAVHLAAAPNIARHLLWPEAADRPLTADDRRPSAGDPPKPEVPLGQEDPGPTSINWITHAAFERLQARQATTDQAALQQEVDPSPLAKTAPQDPTPPAAAAQPSLVTPQSPPTPLAEAPRRSSVQSPPVVARTIEQPRPPAPLVVTDAPVTDQPPTITPPLIALAPTADLILPRPAPAPKTEEASPREVASADKPARPKADSTAVTPQPNDTTTVDPNPSTKPAPQPADPKRPRPTVAPRADREAPPVARIDSLTVTPGEVVTHQGVVIKTITAQFSPVARYTSVPRNPVIRLVFDKEGNVVEAKFILSSGYANIDGPIISSLYKWKATGKFADRFVIEQLNYRLSR